MQTSKKNSIEKLIQSFGISRTLIAKGIGMNPAVFRVYMSAKFPAKHQEKLEKFLSKYLEKLSAALTNYKRKY